MWKLEWARNIVLTYILTTKTIQPFRDEHGNALIGDLTLELKDFLGPEHIPFTYDPAYVHVCRKVRVPFSALVEAIDAGLQREEVNRAAKRELAAARLREKRKTLRGKGRPGRRRSRGLKSTGEGAKVSCLFRSTPMFTHPAYMPFSRRIPETSTRIVAHLPALPCSLGCYT
jgi:hypothetical protein